MKEYRSLLSSLQQHEYIEQHIRGQMGPSVKVKHEGKIMMSSISNGLRHDYRRAAIAPRLDNCLWMDFSATTVLRLVRDAQIQTGLAHRRVW